MTLQTGRDLSTGAGEESGAKVRRLSFAQEQLWFLDQLAPGETTYNSLKVWRLHGPLRVDVLQRCLNLVVARHESLRITIGDDAGTPYQVVAPATEFPLPVTDLRELPEAEREQRVQAEIRSQRAEPYDLQTGPLYRFQLLRLDAEEYVFCQGFHHIVTDGWSAAVLNTELSTAYRSLCSGAEPVFEDQELDYTEFAESQRERLQGEVLAEELAFWQQRLADLPVLNLPIDRPRPVGGSYHGHLLVKDLPDDLRGVVERLARDHHASMFMVLAAAFNLVLSRYTNQTDIPIGIPMLGRPEKKLESVVGMFINMVVLRSDLSGDPSFTELIEQMTDGILELYDHQEVSFSEVVDAVQPVRDPDRNPLFEVCMQMLDQRTSGESLSFPGVIAEHVPLTSLNSRFDFTLNVVDTGSSLRGVVEYRDMFDSWRAEAMLTHLATVLRTAAADPTLRLSQIPIVVGEEAEQLLAAGRGRGIDHQQLLQPISQQHAIRQVYVVDPWMNLAPRGVAGELLIGSEPDGSADGYLDQPGLTPEKFIDDPFQPGRQVYRSGDLVCWTSDLQRIEFLGRMDNQTVLRGRGIEFGEIETALTRHPDVARAVVLGRPDQNGEQRLVGYVTPAAERRPEPNELRDHLAATLPDHPIPAAWVVLAEFPLTAGDEIDRGALPEPVDAAEVGYDEPSTPTEQLVADIFGEVLSLPRVGAEDSFFDKGGNSLQAMRAVGRINDEFRIRLSVRTLYGNVTVRAVSAAVDQKVDGRPA